MCHPSASAASFAACAVCFSLRAMFRVCHDFGSVFGFGFSFLCDSRLFGVVVDAMCSSFSSIVRRAGQHDTAKSGAFSRAAGQCRFAHLLVGTRCFSSSLQFNTTVNGTDALGPTGVTRRNRLPSAVTSPTIAPGGV